MISPVYVALSSACMTHSRLPQYASLVALGNFSEARALAKQASQINTDILSISCMHQAAADMSILLKDYEQAEVLYADSVSVLLGSPHLNAMSCRATGIQALFQNRFDIAAHCFKRNTEGTVPLEYSLEGYATLALICREVGLDREAYENYKKMRSLAENSHLEDWLELSKLLALDLAAYRAIYASPEISDHIFRNMVGSVKNVTDDLHFYDDPGDLTLAKELNPVIRTRKEQLKKVIALAEGKQVDWASLKNVLSSPFASSSHLYEKYSCLEIGLASIAGGHREIAETLMQENPWLHTKCTNKTVGTVRIDQNERLYFIAKMKTKGMIIEEHNNLYQIYLENTFKAIYEITNKLEQTLLKPSMKARTSSIQLDESALSAKKINPIPVRCLRAFEYIKENSWRSDVSVYEVASIIGVSVRWLQLQFKHHYGCSPKRMIRDQRQVSFS